MATKKAKGKVESKGDRTSAKRSKVVRAKPKKVVSRDLQLKVMLSRKEKKDLVDSAAEAHMPISEYVRGLLRLGYARYLNALATD